MEFLRYAAGEFSIINLTHIRKRHLAAYIRFLRRRRCSDYRIAKQVYAFCFWFAIAGPGAGLPNFDGLCKDFPELLQARYSIKI